MLGDQLTKFFELLSRKGRRVAAAMGARGNASCLTIEAKQLHNGPKADPESTSNGLLRVLPVKVRGNNPLPQI